MLLHFMGLFFHFYKLNKLGLSQESEISSRWCFYPFSLLSWGPHCRKWHAIHRPNILYNLLLQKHHWCFPELSLTQTHWRVFTPVIRLRRVSAPKWQPKLCRPVAISTLTFCSALSVWAWKGEPTSCGEALWPPSALSECEAAQGLLSL